MWILYEEMTKALELSVAWEELFSSHFHLRVSEINAWRDLAPDQLTYLAVRGKRVKRDYEKREEEKSGVIGLTLSGHNLFEGTEMA